MKNKYEIQETDYGVTWINVLQKNSRGETIKICITECKNRGGKHALPVLCIKLDIPRKSLKHIFVWTHMYMIQKGNAEVTITQRYFQVA